MADFTKASSLIDAYFSEANLPREALTLFKVWKNVVSSVQPRGEAIANHSRVIDFKNGVVHVEADHAGWIQLLQLHKNYITKGLQMRLPELKIRSFAIHLVKNSNFTQKLKDASFTVDVNLGAQNISDEADEQSSLQTNENVSTSQMDDKLKELFAKLKSDIQNY